jgi:hypothetical protein
VISDGPHGPTDFYYRKYVPKEPAANIAWRRALYMACTADPELAREVWIICSRDILFYINCFGWLLEARDPAGWNKTPVFGDLKEIPFITRDYQDPVILKIQALLGKKDARIKKSRETGLSWMLLYLTDHEWRFKQNVHAGLLSKDDDSVGAVENPDSLFAKLRFIEEHLPLFLQSQWHSKMKPPTLVNLETRSTIVGDSATPTAFRSGRKKFIVQDEMHFFPPEYDYAVQDSLRGVTPSRIMVSTVNRQRGQSGAFFDICQQDPTDIFESIEVSWRDDKEKARGLYTTGLEGGVRFLDRSGYVHPIGYKFILDGKVRSPYYDHEWLRPTAIPAAIAAELDMDFGGASEKFFDASVIALAMEMCVSAKFKGRMLREGPGMWVPDCKADVAGDCEFWMDIVPDAEDRIIIVGGRQYSLGIDISAGTGGAASSYSAFVVIDRETGEQVFQWKGNTMKPDLLARFSCAVGYFFNTAIIAPEVQGAVGKMFLDQFLQMDYPNPYVRPSTTESIEVKYSLRVGINNRDAGETLLGDLQSAMRHGKFKPRSLALVKELERYFYSDGKLKHPLVGKNRDNAPERSHGDLAIAAACAWRAVRDVPIASPEETPEGAPYGSWMHSRIGYLRGEERGHSWWKPLTSNPETLHHSAEAYPEDEPVLPV